MTDWKRLSLLPAKELRELQNKKLRYFISRQLYPFSPHYQKIFDKHKIKPRHIKTVDDLKVIPFTQKEDLFSTEDKPQKFRDFILQPDARLIQKHSPKFKLLKFALLKAMRGEDYLKECLAKEYRPIFLTATAGTTNQPVSFLYSHFDLENLRIYGYRLLEVFAAQGDIRAVNLFPYAPHLAFWQTVFAGMAHNNFILSTGGGKIMGTLGNIEAISKVRPDVLIGVPSYIYHLARSATEMKKDFSFVKKIILGASRVPLGFKDKLALLFNEMGAEEVCIIGTYGFTEAKCAWAECPTDLKSSSGYHLYPDKEIFEVVDPDSGRVKKEGEDGELVYTSIDARGSCVLRYRTGDLVKGGIIYAPCPYCQRTLARISSDISRLSNIQGLMFSKIKGALVNLNDLNSILETEDEIEEWQVELRKKNNDPYEVDELVIYLSLTRETDAGFLKEKLKNKIQVATEVTPNEIIVLGRKEMLERVEMEVSHKVKRLIDLRPKN